MNFQYVLGRLISSLTIIRINRGEYFLADEW
jgi:hypothetical protein